MTPISDWIPVAPDVPNTSGGIPILPTTPLAPFNPASIPDITGLPGFTPSISTIPAVDVGSPFIPTWPGTDIPIGGTINPNDYPKVWGPVLVDAMNEIANTYDKLKEEGVINTPFSGDTEREREAVIQQTFCYICHKLTVVRSLSDPCYKAGAKRP